MKCHACSSPATWGRTCANCELSIGTCDLHRSLSVKSCLCSKREPVWGKDRSLETSKFELITTKSSKQIDFIEEEELEEEEEEDFDDLIDEEEEIFEETESLIEIKDVKEEKKIIPYSRANVVERFKQGTIEATLKQGGRWSKNVVKRGTQSFTGKDDARALRWLCAQLFWFIKEQIDDSEDEVEAMLAGDRIIVAANDDASMKALAEALLKYGGSMLAAMLMFGLDRLDDRRKRNAMHFVRLFKGSFLNGSNVAEILKTIATCDDGAKVFTTLDISDDKQCIAALTDKKHANKIIFVTAGGSLGENKSFVVHAEQKLVYALYRSGAKGPVVIRGKKRPCSGCSLVLRYAKKRLNLDIDFNPNPGGFWDPSLNGLDKIVTLHIQSMHVKSEDVMTWMHDNIDEIAGKMHVTHFLTATLAKKMRRKDFQDEGIKISDTKKPSFHFTLSGYDSGSESEEEEKGEKWKSWQEQIAGDEKLNKYWKHWKKTAGERAEKKKTKKKRKKLSEDEGSEHDVDSE